jgi:hypothetical protein
MKQWETKIDECELRTTAMVVPSCKCGQGQLRTYKLLRSDCSHPMLQLASPQCMRAAHRQRQREHHTARCHVCNVSDAQPCRRASQLGQGLHRFSHGKRNACGRPGRHLVNMRRLRTVDAGCLVPASNSVSEESQELARIPHCDSVGSSCLARVDN